MYDLNETASFILVGWFLLLTANMGFGSVVIIFDLFFRRASYRHYDMVLKSLMGVLALFPLALFAASMAIVL
jgi:hypothetical protein